MFRKFLLSLVVVLSAAAVRAQAPVAAGVSVQIQPSIGGGHFCLDARNDHAADGAPVYVYQCQNTENQRWTITTSAEDKHAIIGIGGFCLDVRGITNRANGTPIQLWRCHFQANQRFHLTNDGRIKEIESGKCLVALAAKDGAPVVLDTCTNAPNEVFISRH